jgi:cellulose synthase/poly-beta-1,6-N-acetylglucosamine synthase-like glycosyltransferase
MAPTATIETGTGASARLRGRPEAGLSIVVPLFNEADNLAALHARIVDVARSLKATRGLATEVVYVDDGSRDGTLAVARSLAADSLDLQVIALSRNFGKEAASIPHRWSTSSWAIGSTTATTSSTPRKPTARASRGSGGSASRRSIR